MKATMLGDSISFRFFVFSSHVTLVILKSYSKPKNGQIREKVVTRTRFFHGEQKELKTKKYQSFQPVLWLSSAVDWNWGNASGLMGREEAGWILVDVYAWLEDKLVCHFKLMVDLVRGGNKEFEYDVDRPSFLKRELVGFGMNKHQIIVHDRACGPVPFCAFWEHVTRFPNIIILKLFPKIRVNYYREISSHFYSPTSCFLVFLPNFIL